MLKTAPFGRRTIASCDKGCAQDLAGTNVIAVVSKSILFAVVTSSLLSSPQRWLMIRSLSRQFMGWRTTTPSLLPARQWWTGTRATPAGLGSTPNPLACATVAVASHQLASAGEALHQSGAMLAGRSAHKLAAIRHPHWLPCWRPSSANTHPPCQLSCCSGQPTHCTRDASLSWQLHRRPWHLLCCRPWCWLCCCMWRQHHCASTHCKHCKIARVGSWINITPFLCRWHLI